MQTYLISKTFARRHLSGFIISILALIVSLAPTLASGAEIYGHVSRNGAAVDNKPILVNDRQVGQTDAAGDYWLSLPPGQYTLTIEGENVPIVVPPPGVKQDIQLQ